MCFLFCLEGGGERNKISAYLRYIVNKEWSGKVILHVLSLSHRGRLFWSQLYISVSWSGLEEANTQRTKYMRHIESILTDEWSQILFRV